MEKRPPYAPPTPFFRPYAHVRPCIVIRTPEYTPKPFLCKHPTPLQNFASVTYVTGRGNTPLDSQVF